MTKPVWSHVWPRVLSETKTDCVRYIIGVFFYNFKSRTFLLHINTLACVKAEM